MPRSRGHDDRASNKRMKPRDADVERIRQLAIDIARREAQPGMMLVCNPISEPTPLPPTELLYDTCAWCDTAIYYDRLMPSPPDTKRICIQCFVTLRQAEEKGAN